MHWKDKKSRFALLPQLSLCLGHVELEMNICIYVSNSLENISILKTKSAGVPLDGGTFNRKTVANREEFSLL